jgi:hypothetical protein
MSMSEKIGRNEPCWCGSGKKYKHCHYRRERQEAASRQDVVETLQKGFRKGECLHPEAPINCQGGIIKAHTIQNNGGLTKIAKNGHVYTPFAVIPSFNDKLAMNKVGINRASTFTGFCKYHDNSLFAPIEDHPLQISQHHALLLAFRAICRELYAKRRARDMFAFGKSLDRGKDLETQIFLQKRFSDYQFGTEAGLHDLEHYKRLIDTAIITGDFSDVHYYAIVFDQTPEVLCSGAVYPEYDFHGKAVQDLWKATITGNLADCIAYSLLATDIGGIAFFSWIGKSKGNEQFVRSLDAMTDDNIPYALLRLTF